MYKDRTGDRGRRMVGGRGDKRCGRRKGVCWEWIGDREEGAKMKGKEASVNEGRDERGAV